MDPAPQHLQELKALIYDNPELHKGAEVTRNGFSRISNETLSFTLPLDSEAQRIALIKMTPYYWRLPEQKLTSIVEQLNEVTADFNIQLFRKQCSKSDD